MAFEIIEGKTIKLKDSDGKSVDKQWIGAGCLEADSKPIDTSFAVGSYAIEADTGDVYFFTGSAWVKQFSLQG